MKERTSMAQGKKVHIVGAGVPGMVAGVTLSKKGYDVLILEAAPRVGDVPWNPRIDATPLDVPMVSDYIGIDLSQAEGIKPLKEGATVYVGTRSLRLDNLPSDACCLIERGAREPSLDNFLYKEALKAGVTFSFSTPVKDFDKLPDPTIVATGMNPRAMDALGIPHRKYVGFTAYVDNPGTCYQGTSLYLDDYEADYFYAPFVNNLWFGMIWRGIEDKITKAHLEKCASQIKERLGFEVKWTRCNLGIATERLDNPTLFSGKKILAGPISGIQDPLIGFGSTAALISGKIAAIAIEDEERALEDFKSFNTHFERSYLERAFIESLPKASSLALASSALRLVETLGLELALLGLMQAHVPGFSKGKAYFEKAKEGLGGFMEKLL
jgi:flavin-dependent dehydrogenase